MVQWEYLPRRPDDLSIIPRTHIKVVRENRLYNCPLTSICVLWNMHPPMCYTTDTHTTHGLEGSDQSHFLW